MATTAGGAARRGRKALRKVGNKEDERPEQIASRAEWAIGRGLPHVESSERKPSAMPLARLPASMPATLRSPTRPSERPTPASALRISVTSCSLGCLSCAELRGRGCADGWAAGLRWLAPPVARPSRAALAQLSQPGQLCSPSQDWPKYASSCACRHTLVEKAKARMRASFVRSCSRRSYERERERERREAKGAPQRILKLDSLQRGSTSTKPLDLSHVRQDLTSTIKAAALPVPLSHAQAQCQASHCKQNRPEADSLLFKFGPTLDICGAEASRTPPHTAPREGSCRTKPIKPGVEAGGLRWRVQRQEGGELPLSGEWEGGDTPPCRARL